MSAEETLQHYFKDAPTEELARLGDLKNSYYREVASQEGIVFAPGAVELLKVLHKAGFKQAIGSGTHMQNLEIALGQFPWLRDYLEVKSSRTTFPGQSPTLKFFCWQRIISACRPRTAWLSRTGCWGWKRLNGPGWLR